MPDAHVGYGLPIGGVLALRERGHSVRRRRRHRLPDEAVGARPAGGVRSTTARCSHVFDGRWSGARVFGVGSRARASGRITPVMDGTGASRGSRASARTRPGSSSVRRGSGNHFVEFGMLTLDERDDELGLDAGEYVALMSHCGSRGVGQRSVRRTAPSPRAGCRKRYRRPAASWRGSTSTQRRDRSTGPR